MPNDTQTTSSPSGDEIRRVTEALTDAGKALMPVLRGVALLREEADDYDLDDDAVAAMAELTDQQKAVADVVRMFTGDEGAGGVRLLDYVFEAQQRAEVEGHTETRAETVPQDEYQDREILGVVVPGALAAEADEIIWSLVDLRMRLMPVVGQIEAHTAKVEAVSRDVIASMRAAATDCDAVNEADDGIHALVSELTESRRLCAMAHNLVGVVTDANF